MASLQTLSISRKKKEEPDFENPKSHQGIQSTGLYKNWVEGCVVDMENANERGDIRSIFKIVSKLSDKPKPPPANITTDEAGHLLKSQQIQPQDGNGFSNQNL